jgi:hypothetical protein
MACLVLVMGNVRAEQKLYSLEIPDGQAATFEVPFWVEHPGEISVHAEWSSKRPLAFRIEPPGGDGVAMRRTATSPIQLTMDVQPNQLRQGPWTLTIHALPLNGAGQGLLTINLPEPPAPDTLKPTQPERLIEDWQKPRSSHKELDQKHRRVIQSTESFRKLLVESKNRSPDTCRWQDGLLQWLAKQRDRAIDENAEPDPATGKLINRMVEVIRTVDELRQSRDPALIGPRPTERAERTNWDYTRMSQLRSVERSLDELLSAVQRDYAPELQGEQWPLRMVSCLTATERYFEERWIAGSDNTPNRDLAEAQWRPLNRAATALEALAGLAKDDVIRLGTRK